MVAINLAPGSQFLLVGFETGQTNLDGTSHTIMSCWCPTDMLLVRCVLIEAMQAPRLVTLRHPRVVP